MNNKIVVAMARHFAEAQAKRADNPESAEAVRTACFMAYLEGAQAGISLAQHEIKEAGKRLP